MKLTTLPAKINGLEVESFSYNIKDGRLKGIAYLFRHHPSMKYAHTEKDSGWSDETLAAFDRLIDCMETDILETQFGVRDSDDVIEDDAKTPGLHFPDDEFGDTLEQQQLKSLDAITKGERYHVEYEPEPLEIDEF